LLSKRIVHRSFLPRHAIWLGGLLSGRRRLRIEGIEQLRSLDRRLQRGESSPHDLETVGVVFLGPEVGVTNDMFDPRPLDDAGGAGRHRQLMNRGDDRGRDAGSLDFLRDRCAATIAGPSGGDE